MFETNKQVIAIADTVVKIIHHKASFLQYKQLRLNKSFRQYLETSNISKKSIQNDHSKTNLPKTLRVKYRHTILLQRIDNSIGSHCHQFKKEATNISPYATVTMPKFRAKQCKKFRLKTSQICTASQVSQGSTQTRRCRNSCGKKNWCLVLQQLLYSTH